FLYYQFYPDSIQAFLAFFCFKSYLVTFLYLLFQAIDMNKYTFLAFQILNKSIAFGIIEKGYRPLPDQILRIRSFPSGNPNFYILGLYDILFLGIRGSR